MNNSTNIIAGGDKTMWKDPQIAFEQAIKEGRLSDIPGQENYAGRYMYMGPTIDGKRDAFKHRLTREYLQ